MERLVCLLIGYAFGLFQTSYILGKRHNIDIRQHGSGNAGTTNAMRIMGKKAGAITLLGDCLKCVAAITLVRFLFAAKYPEILPLLMLYAGAGVILGHNFPFYLNFRGGKGIAASVGLILAFDWRLFVICFFVFWGIFFATHYVSLCSMTSYVVALLSMIVIGQRGIYGMDQPHLLELYIVMGCLTILAIYRHRSNIGRLLHGNENKMYLGKTKKKG